MNNTVDAKLRFSTADIGLVMVLLGAIFSGLRPLFGRWLMADGLTAVVIALTTFVASTLIFLPIGLQEIRWAHQHRGTAFLALGSGLFIGLGSLAYFEALQRLPVAIVTLIFFTYPAIVIAATAVIRRRWPQPRALLAVTCVLAGCGLIVDPSLPSLQDRVSPLIDFAIAFIAPLSWATLLMLLAGPLTGLTPWSRIGFIAGGATLAMVVVVVIWLPTTLIPYTIAGWLAVVGLVLVSGIFTHILMTIGVPKAGPERSSIAGVFEVATSLAVGWLIFLEPVTFRQGVGVLLIGTALLLTRRLETGSNDTAESP